MRHLQLPERIPNGIDSNPKVLGTFLQRGRRMLRDMLPQGQPIQLSLSGPMPFRREIGAPAPIMYTPETDAKPSSGFGFAAAFLHKLNHPFPQIDTVGHSSQQYT